jgi:hypothetical protein
MGVGDARPPSTKREGGLSDEDVILWQDVLDLVMSGRTSNLTCPFCKNGQLKVHTDERKTRVLCESCRKFIETSPLQPE